VGQGVGAAAGYAAITPLLADEFTVLIYDRRGHFAGTGDRDRWLSEAHVLLAEGCTGLSARMPTVYPLRHPDGSVDGLGSRKIEVTDCSATMDGQAVPFVEDTAASHADTNFILRGDEHREITGDHDYRFQYEVRGLLNAPVGHPELFWDALGHESKVPVDHAEVTVTAPGLIGRVRCVITGVESDTTRVSDDSVRFAANGIGANTAVTVTVALPDTVTVPPPILRSSRTFTAS